MEPFYRKYNSRLINGNSDHLVNSEYDAVTRTDAHPVNLRPELSYQIEDSDRYNTNYKRRGKAIIINNLGFNAQEYRTGADIDTVKLKEALEYLGFDVEEHTDCSSYEMLSIVDQASGEDHNDCDCFLLAVSTHGEEGLLLGSDDLCVSVNDMTLPFRSTQSLLGKPKIFIIQACRGTRSMPFHEVKRKRSSLETDGKIPDSSQTRQPCYPDFLYVFATPIHFYANRDWVNLGSLLIAAFWFVITVADQNGSKDIIEGRKEIMEILVEMNKQLCGIERLQDKQVASIESTLTKELYFTTKERDS